MVELYLKWINGNLDAIRIMFMFMGAMALAFQLTISILLSSIDDSLKRLLKRTKGK